MNNANDANLRVPGCPGLWIDRKAQIYNAYGIRLQVDRNGKFQFINPINGKSAELSHAAVILAVGMDQPSKPIAMIAKRGVARHKDEESKCAFLRGKGFSEKEIAAIMDLPHEFPSPPETVPAALLLARLDEIEEDFSDLFVDTADPDRISRGLALEIMTLAMERKRIRDWLFGEGEQGLIGGSVDTQADGDGDDSELSEMAAEIESLRAEVAELEKKLSHARKLNNHLLWLTRKENIGPDRGRMEEDGVGEEVFAPLDGGGSAEEGLAWE